jgi:ankyrin repeat protein
MGQSQSKKILVLELLEYSGYLSLYDLCILYNCSKNIPLNMICYVSENPNYIFDFFELNENIMIHLLKFVLNKYNPNINNLFNLNNYSILHIATKKKYNKSIKLLASSPYFDVNIAENSKGWTPLWIACRYGYVETLKTLLFIENSEKLESNKKQIIADVNKHSTYDITPLHIACSIGHVECVKTLLKIPNIDVNKADKEGITSLFAAAWCGHKKCVEALLNNESIDINKATNDGTTPLMAAIRNNRIEIIRILQQKSGET